MRKIETLEITCLAYGGDGFGRLPDGRACFVPFTLPGEQVRVRLTEEKSGHARARLLEVLRPSAERIQPPCRHFGICGGCHYQHLPYPAQLAAKQRIFAEQLTRIAGIPNPPVRPIVASPIHGIIATRSSSPSDPTASQATRRPAVMPWWRLKNAACLRLPSMNSGRRWIWKLCRISSE